MAVFRIDKTRDYTVMSNHHLRNTELSLKAKGLLSLMLSLPDNWDYTTKGLARICKDGVENPVQVKPILENPVLGKPEQEIPAQSNKDKSNTNLSITEPSNSIRSNPPAPEGRNGTDGMEARKIYREIVYGNIEYDILREDNTVNRDQLDEIAELIVDTVCSARKTIRIAGDDYPAEVVKSRFLKLDSSHVQYVIDCMKNNTTYVRNIKKYLLAALYNAPATINNYYSSLVQHDLYGGGERGG